jgi:uncharacterized protein RhaS with RHS repeats
METQTAYTYDALNRRTAMTDALGFITQWPYDKVGNLIQLTDANGNPTKYTYDAVKRPLFEIYADRTMPCFNYDPVGI